ncbi:hydroxymethylglutaryl-CoA lyase [Amycolatopsis pithecellobii]|uniref:Hydroxymethylglutaryl-CoA lyase n=1 Tax=Amycolatopsis pithecellobii TaxID=664692 RepID=A0A6N7Z590_9PSEU|nr:hydroxymethylglutaryl-CoA lyase [Amycolatopsis pithecellobii]MTD54576.1 hydroxymethylglutaryl-CoA lyase [Amycolatopsis pithecellobii]
MTGSIEIVEVAPRDGLQNEEVVLSTSDKLKLIERAIEAGAKRIEATSFVNPARIPQMADAEAVAAALPRERGVTFVGLVLNKRGAIRAVDAGMDELGAVAVASDGLGRRNQGQSSAESVAVAGEIVEFAHAQGRAAQITIAAAFGCPFEGNVAPGRVIAIARQVAESKPREVALADTIGVAAPGQVGKLVRAVREAIAPIPLRVHFHNTRNTGLANVWAAVMAGAQTVDAAVGGIGGCPFSPGAAGNVATEDVVYLLERSGIGTSMSLDQLIETAHWLGDVVGHRTPGMVARAASFPPVDSV